MACLRFFSSSSKIQWMHPAWWMADMEGAVPSYDTSSSLQSFEMFTITNNKCTV